MVRPLGKGQREQRESSGVKPTYPAAGHAAEVRGVLARSDLRGLAGAAAHGDEE